MGKRIDSRRRGLRHLATAGYEKHREGVDSAMNRDEAYEALKTEHWDDVHNWVGIEAIIDKISQHTKCSVEELREMMRDIEAKHPKRQKKKPQTWRRVLYKRPCRTCGELIGFAETEQGNVMPVNLHDFTTHWACEKPGKPKKKKDRK